MAVEEYCRRVGCWLKAGHQGVHQEHYEDMPMTCQCAQPRPNRLDECMNPKCRRVIAERVNARRAQR